MIGLAAWAITVRAQRTRLEEGLARAVQMFNIGYASHIRLAEFTDFEWDLFYIFPPYTSGDQIVSTLGYDWFGVRFTSIAESDNVNLLVFMREGRVVRWVELPRSTGDFALLADDSPFTLEAAVFIMVGNDGRVFQLLEAPE